MVHMIVHILYRLSRRVAVSKSRYTKIDASSETDAKSMLSKVRTGLDDLAEDIPPPYILQALRRSHKLD